MANERTYPLLPCRDIDESIAFYETLGFRKTYRQVRPNPYAVVALEDIHIHLFGIEGFNPVDSYGSVIVAVPDPDSLYHGFAAGWRKTYGKLPVAGIPRILRPRKKYGTVRGFSVVDPGGNWLRISKLGDSEEEDSAEKAEGLAQILYVAARLGMHMAMKVWHSKPWKAVSHVFQMQKLWSLQRRIYTRRNWLCGSGTMIWRNHPSRQRSRWS